jgi:hypothetical protein
LGAAARLGRVGALRVPGAPAVTVGGRIAIADVPDEALNGSFLVLGVRHCYHKRQGFTTRIAFSTPGDAAAGGRGGFLGGLP